MSATRTREGARDFDFWMGSWKVHNRYLRERLKGSNDWLEFEATSVARPLSGVLGNQDEFRTEHDGGFVGMSFRFFDPTPSSGRSTGRTAGGPACSTRRCSAPSPATSASSRARTPSRARPILVRFIWSGITTPTPALGAGVLGGRRRDVGDQLDHGLHAARRAESPGLLNRARRGGCSRRAVSFASRDRWGAKPPGGDEARPVGAFRGRGPLVRQAARGEEPACEVHFSSCREATTRLTTQKLKNGHG